LGDEDRVAADRFCHPYSEANPPRSGGEVAEKHLIVEVSVGVGVGRRPS
jgi:hypothetical protein